MFMYQIDISCFLTFCCRDRCVPAAGQHVPGFLRVFSVCGCMHVSVYVHTYVSTPEAVNYIHVISIL